MKAKLLPLEGKHYGSKIEITDGEISTIVTVWERGDGTPSERELALHGITKDQWDRNDMVDNGWGGTERVRELDMICSSHFESEWQYQLCKKIISAFD